MRQFWAATTFEVSGGERLLMGQENSKATKAKTMEATHSGVGLLGESSKVEDAEMLGQEDKEEEDVLDWLYTRWGKQI